MKKKKSNTIKRICLYPKQRHNAFMYTVLLAHTAVQTFIVDSLYHGSIEKKKEKQLHIGTQ